MAIYHCSIKIVGRSSKAGAKSAVGAAAYRSGSRLYNSWNGETYDYTRKGGVLHSEIMLPDHAPRSFLDRSVLWNSVEMAEKRSDAQLAREIEVSLPVELGFEEHLQIIREYCEPFRAAGMCVDFNIHAKEGNPHCHIMLTMRPLDENGKWLPKSRLVYDVDKKGKRIKLPSGKWKSHKENLVDWNEQRKAEEWRAAWADIVNRHLTHAGVEERIDHRSNEARGIQELPGVHMGPAACAMEKKGIRTERGDLNRSIKAANTTASKSIVPEWPAAHSTTTNTATMQIVGRDQEDQELSVEFDRERCYWNLLNVEKQVKEKWVPPVFHYEMAFVLVYNLSTTFVYFQRRIIPLCKIPKKI